MRLIEKARQDAEPFPDSVRQDNSESKSSVEFAQALARSVFGRHYVVVRAPVPKRNPRITAPSRIRAWRASDGR
jgi:hypothetical protein